MRARRVLVLVVAVLLGASSGRVVGAPTTPLAQSTGTSGSGSGGGDSGSSGGGDSGSSGSGGGEDGGGDSGSSGGGEGDDAGGGGGGDDAGGGSGDGGGGEGGDAGGGGDGADAGAPQGPPPQVAPPAEPIPDDRVADGEPTDCGDGAAARCYAVDDAEGTEGVRVPDGQGGFVVVPIVAVPVVNVDSGASTSAASNVDLQVRIDDSTGDVRVERRVDDRSQLAVITLALLLGMLVGAAVLGTFLRFRRGPVR